MRKLYVCSKPLVDSNGVCHRHLLGILSQDKNGRYQFQYTLGKENSKSLLISVFPDKEKIYGDHDARLLLDDYLPSENDTAFIKEILKKTEMSEYDEWEWLKAFESTDENAETKLFETLPDDIIIHDKSYDRLSIDNLIENSDDNDEEFEPNEDTSTFEKFEDDECSDEYDELENEEPNEPTTGNILDHTEIPDVIDDADYDFDSLDDAFVFDDDLNGDTSNKDENKENSSNNMLNRAIVDTENTERSVEKSEFNKPTTVRLITKKITRRVKKSGDINDFITPPPEDPSDIIQQRLEQNIKQRQNILNEKIKTNTI